MDDRRLSPDGHRPAERWQTCSTMQLQSLVRMLHSCVDSHFVAFRTEFAVFLRQIQCGSQAATEAEKQIFLSFGVLYALVFALTAVQLTRVGRAQKCRCGLTLLTAEHGLVFALSAIRAALLIS